mgnify:CR=1 FL=1|tara:strand:- start:45 stop:542 length:498 start_codon:yes stop_codon:yes gene_type:complete
MSKNELEKILDNTVALSYREKVKEIEDYLVSIADGVNVVGNGREVTYGEGLWEYKHSFAEGLYIREMKMKKGQLGFSAIHKHSYGFFLLSGTLASSKEDSVEEFIAPCYIISPQGAKRIVYAIEDCVIATVHANPTNTEDLDELARINVLFDWDEYNEYTKNNKE